MDDHSKLSGLNSVVPDWLLKSAVCLCCTFSIPAAFPVKHTSVAASSLAGLTKEASKCFLLLGSIVPSVKSPRHSHAVSSHAAVDRNADYGLKCSPPTRSRGLLIWEEDNSAPVAQRQSSLSTIRFDLDRILPLLFDPSKTPKLSPNGRGLSLHLCDQDPLRQQ